MLQRGHERSYLIGELESLGLSSIKINQIMKDGGDNNEARSLVQNNQGLSSVEIQRGSSIENNNILELSQLQNVQSLRYKKPLMKTCSIATPKKLYASSIKIEILGALVQR